MVSGMVGGQWNEGDVSCSVVRRVALPDAFFALDGLFETFLSVLEGFGAFPAVADRELAEYLPFVASTRVLMASLKAGAGRETAHEVIKEHAVATALDLRESDADFQPLVDRLAIDDRLPLTAADLASLLGEPLELAGRAQAQTAAVVARIGAICDQYPDAATYTQNDIF